MIKMMNRQSYGSELSSSLAFATTAAPRLEVPENYLDGLIFRQEEVVRLKVPLVAKPNPTVSNVYLTSYTVP